MMEKPVMESHYKTFFVISVLFHVIVIIFIVKLFSMNNLEFDYEEKQVKVTVVKQQAVKKSLLKKSSQVQALSHPVEEVPDESVSVVETGYQVKKEASVPEVLKKYDGVNEKKTVSKSIAHKQITGFEEDDFDIDIEKELEFLDSSPIRFETGEYREILVDLAAEFKKLDFLASTTCKVRIVIDETGTVTEALILESSGEPLNDNIILDLVQKWKFEQNSLSRQTAVVEMKYFYR